MKSNDLRLGNIVDVFGHIKTVGRIDNEGVYCVLDNCETALSVHLNNWEQVEGVPLTEEWLLKFGFKKSSEGFYKKKTLKNKPNLEINIKSKRAILFSALSYKDLLFPKYVHQLQNLYFALTGEELNTN